MSYPSPHVNEHVSLVTRPLHFIRPLGGAMMASHGRPVRYKDEWNQYIIFWYTIMETTRKNDT